jgi:septum formation protein
VNNESPTAVAITLASASPRRREILATLGLEFSIAAPDVDETPLDGETAEDMVLRLAVAKAEAVRTGTSDIVIAADTAVVVDGRMLGKPENREDCLAMLDALSGRTHTVCTGVALHCRDVTHTAMSTTDVLFRDISRDEALAYWQSGEPRDKAGAYAVQGLGGVFVERIEGSYSGVVGLPVFETASLLRQVGFDLVTRR